VFFKYWLINPNEFLRDIEQQELILMAIDNQMISQKQSITFKIIQNEISIAHPDIQKSILKGLLLANRWNK